MAVEALKVAEFEYTVITWKRRSESVVSSVVSVLRTLDFAHESSTTPPLADLCGPHGRAFLLTKPLDELHQPIPQDSVVSAPLPSLNFTW
jgi:hypothetical protein